MFDDILVSININTPMKKMKGMKNDQLLSESCQAMLTIVTSLKVEFRKKLL